MPCRVLFCDDRRSERQSFLRQVAEPLGSQINCEVSSSFGGVRSRIDGGESFDVLVTDLNFDQIGGGTKEGLQILSAARIAWPAVEVVIFTAYPDSLMPQEVLEASDNGLTLDTWVRKVSDRPSDSWRRLREIVALLSRAVGERLGRAVREDQSIDAAAARWAGATVDNIGIEDRCPACPELVGGSEAMQKLHERIRRVAPTRLPVLIYGERGSGKELVARAIHRASGCTGAFLAANCSEFTPELLASELFGHERGAFTGAVTRREGLLAAASGGTFFLDEVAELQPASQVQLLRVLECGEYRTVGGSEPVASDARVVAATNRDLASLKQEGNFRGDLLARLNRYFLFVPPLSARRVDIPPIALAVLARLATRFERAASTFDEEALKLLATAPWPGNVREIESVLVRALVELDPAAEVIGAVDLALDSALPSVGGDLLVEVLSGRMRLSLTEVAKRFGLPSAKRLVERTMLHFDGLPPDEETRRLFDMSYRNWQHWAYYRGLTWEKVRTRHRS